MTSSAIETYDLLAALFCLPGEFQQDPDVDEALLSELRDGSARVHTIEALRCIINILLEDDVSRSLALHVRLPFATSGGQTVKLHLAQPAWLERKPFGKLSEELRVSLESGPGQEDPSALVMAAVEFLKENGPAYMPMASSRCEADVKIQRQPTDPLVYVRLPCLKDVQNLTIHSSRIWMHLPSLSTRSKRQDLVDYASSYGITGIVSAGKPGLLILEGPSASAVESYLSFIKTHSWADIPAGRL